MVATGESKASIRAEVIAAGEHWSTAQRRLVRLVVELDDSGEWNADGSATCAHWVASALGIEVCTAREWLRVGRALRRLSAIDGAFESDQLSYSKVRALTRVATPQNEAELCRLALRVAAGRLPHALASWLARHETPEETETRQRNATALRTWTDPDGMVAMSLRLPPLEGGILMAAVDTKVAQFRPDALVGLVAGGGAAIQTELVLHVRGDGCTLDDGTPIAGSIVERIAPASFLRALIHDAERRPINASGAHRHPTRRQKRVVKERDRVCGNCGSSDFLQYDHVPDCEETGHTLIDELFLKCSNCHRDRHRQAPRRE